MLYTETKLRGAFVVDMQKFEDERGYFAYMFEGREAEKHGINTKVAQVKLSYNRLRGTLRGLHLQIAPAIETKFIRCIRGAVMDVIVDLRPESPTYLQHTMVELSAENGRALYIPGLFAHAYQTLTDDAEVMYLAGEFYAPKSERGLRYDDPALKIQWPLPVVEISPKDRQWPLLTPEGVK
jgi:dTDP-4-dehydrorhamnose 3,5-epimerase